MATGGNKVGGAKGASALVGGRGAPVVAVGSRMQVQQTSTELHATNVGYMHPEDLAQLEAQFPEATKDRLGRVHGVLSSLIVPLVAMGSVAKGTVQVNSAARRSAALAIEDGLVVQLVSHASIPPLSTVEFAVDAPADKAAKKLAAEEVQKVVWDVLGDFALTKGQKLVLQDTTRLDVKYLTLEGG